MMGMMSQPIVSILLPTFEPNETFLKAAVDSVLHQSYPHWTLLIQDDPSSVPTEEIVQPYLKDSRITFKRNEERLGIGGNWNACLRSVTGTFVQFLFQDDLWYRTFLEESLAVFEREKNVGMISIRHEYKPDEDEETKNFFERGPFRELSEFWETQPATPTQPGRRFLLWWIKQGLRLNVVGEPSFVMLRREVCEEIGTFREEMRQNLDLEYWIRALRVTDIHFLYQNLGIFRVHGNSASMRNDREGKGLSERLRCFDIILKSSEGEMKEAVAQAITGQMSMFWKKFRRRVRTGRQVPSGETWLVLVFFLRHPRLLLRSLAHLKHANPMLP